MRKYKIVTVIFILSLLLVGCGNSKQDNKYLPFNSSSFKSNFEKVLSENNEFRKLSIGEIEEYYGKYMYPLKYDGIETDAMFLFDTLDDEIIEIACIYDKSLEYFEIRLLQAMIMTCDNTLSIDEAENIVFNIMAGSSMEKTFYEKNGIGYGMTVSDKNTIVIAKTGSEE